MIRLEDLPNPQKRALELVKEVAAEKELRPFLVGGPVRDLILGRHDFIDIDLTLEEGGSTLARALAKRVDGRLRSFPQFLTYKITAEGLPEIDVATARKERYRTPGALPTVTAGRLKDDLLRRDFSINAMALDLMTGELHDPASGARDLASLLIRVLHDESFIDDPTRIFRAVRLATRLGFSLELKTARLLESAIASGALSTIPRERIWRELFLAFGEDSAPNAVAALSAAGVLDVLFGKRPIDRGLGDRLQRTAGAVDGTELDRQVMYTAALLHGDASPVDLEGSGFSQKRARNVIQLANDLGRFTDSLSEAASDEQRFKLFKHASPEMLRIVAVTAPQEQANVARFEEFQSFKLPLRGNDLEVPPGPHVAQALDRTREAVFTGEVPISEARTFAREMAIKYLDQTSEAAIGDEEDGGSSSGEQ
ncbi:MAG: CCA tRNA nucleotidyltransferase [Thermoanaerobaculia bacterium]